jgi:hypothetical protein
MIDGRETQVLKVAEMNDMVNSLATISVISIICMALATELDAASQATQIPSPIQYSGVYPHLAFFGNDGECGTGAVVPWAGRLWAVTYAPHKPKGSAEKLYEINESLELAIRPESIGGTPANRMIHGESQQLFIGPYAIDRQRKVRAIPYHKMPGRPTGNARHLTDPSNKIYYATMEEGFYEVNVHSLQVKTLYPDAHVASELQGADYSLAGGGLLPGYHGKGLYSGQGRLVYANNGEKSQEALRKPFTSSGCLADWNGRDWNIVRRNQFTEVTGPGGIYGNEHAGTDPIWSIGWDHRSLILMLLDNHQWRAYRLPKASHCYDGAHGWNTEWPRIRDVGEKSLLMTMHGMFWHFPATFSAKNSAGIAPRSSYLKVVGDFCRWGDQLIMGCDDAAKNEFTNRRKSKGKVAPPGYSQSNLWFLRPEQLDQFGPPLGRGAVWLNEPVAAGSVSEPYLFAGFDHRTVHIRHDENKSLELIFEVDRDGNGEWHPLRTLTVPAAGYAWTRFQPHEVGAWVRIRCQREVRHMTAFFHYSNQDRRTSDPDPIFTGLAPAGAVDYSGGILRASGRESRNLHFAASTVQGRSLTGEGFYSLDLDMKLQAVQDQQTHHWLKENARVPSGVLTVDAASVIFVEEDGTKYRLPRGHDFYAATRPVPLRIDREVCTERDLFNCHGTFYELPAVNAGGFSKIRPIATHHCAISDYCSWRGLLVMSGIGLESNMDNHHIIRSNDAKCALWVGVIDDLWKLGKPRGTGGPWKDHEVRANQASDPYLMTGFDHKKLTLSHSGTYLVNFMIEIDITGNGDWCRYKTLEVAPERTVEHHFPESFQAYWLRLRTDRDATASGQLVYQ